ncbi:MAG: mandelate racemase/muconate lactonizing enzyme family protein [Synergistaceae bacterium]|jgi:L-alanine-DL-glutamate epimerase-like enolase superfamily enzyme|nr:mandelate racemase/muconate lactonizing enzyme family protein [Synergistaceae bacterium]
MKIKMSHSVNGVEVFWVTTPLDAPVSDSSFTIRNSGMVVVRVTTDSGLSGYGTTFSVALAEYMHKTLKPVVMGKDPICVEDIWNDMRGAVRSAGRKGLALLAISTLDIALWDLRGKILGLPIYKLLGGSKRFIPVYASGGWLSYSMEQTLEEARKNVADGYSVIKIKIGADGGRNLRADVKKVEAVRGAVGDDVDLIVDANGIWDPATAIRFAQMVKDCNVSLFEEPVDADDIPGLRRVREATSMPVATGENEYTKYGMRDLALGQAVDVVQFDITRTGGFTEMQKISAIAQAWNLKLAPHAWEFISAHLMSVAPNALYQEKLSIQERIFKKAIFDYPLPKNGVYEIPDKPGLGVEFDLDFLQKNNQL